MNFRSGFRLVWTPKAGKEDYVTILLVDSDLGFIFWLGQALDAAGYSAVPAVNVASAAELIQEHRLSVETLIIDPFLPDAFPFISHLRQLHPDLHVVAAIPDDWRSFPPLPEIDTILRKPQRLTGTSLIQWLKVIQDFFAEPSSTPDAAEGLALKKAVPN